MDKFLLTQLYRRGVNFQTFTRMASSDSGKFRNRLANEKSPYLLQHASNPVNWYPWGKEAFTKAQEENKPIFLSVGYSTCHWCHVMERESFENEEVGKILNDDFVCIKVDREERPDVDKVYMTFVQATHGSGGWPMSVWLTPDLKPIVGGTYFPPDDRYYGRPGFKSILKKIAQQWVEKRELIDHQGTAILDALMNGTLLAGSADLGCPGRESVSKCYQMLQKSYDEELGGFGKAPKFPQPVNFNFLFHLYATEPNSEVGKTALEMSLQTLRFMARGGINDHVSKGFHRYSTDTLWHVPHFEKMLYDQGQLLVAYATAYQITKDETFADVARDIVEYVTRDLQSPEGGFYSAEDADSYPVDDTSEKKEGAFCVWTYEEIQSLLKEPVEDKPDIKMADIFCFHYDIKEDGNVDPMQDPHDELKNQNVLIVKGSVGQTAEKFPIGVDKTKQILEQCRQILYEVRLKRPKPHLDTKILSAWNGLVISGLAKAGSVLPNKDFVAKAENAASFIQKYLYKADDNVLLRSCYTEGKDVVQGQTVIQGFVDDYTFMIRGLLDLYEASFNDKWLSWAESLQQKQYELFWDTEDGGYFNSVGNDSSLVLRLKEDQDGAEPCSNSVAVSNLLRLSNFIDKPEYIEKANKILTVFNERLMKIPLAVPEMVSGLLFSLSTTKQIILVGDPGSEDLTALIDCVNSHFIPNKVLIKSDGQNDSFLKSKLDILQTLTKKDGKATAYVCENYTCSLPVTSTEQLLKLIS
ncbi:spermatogenesis-associated protein 20-like isoform X1 [Mytilus trossulus]|uniref:spermatogenesis-associated protein 20-like isoform X1 n=1 Tax=Mytilus trossulus TaxID=6551 RepID=UPI00300786E0